MNKYNLLPVLLFCMIMPAGWRHSGNTDRVNVKQDTAGVDLNSPKKVGKLFSDIFSDVSFIPLENGKQSPLSFVNDVLYFKGNFFIKDNTHECIFCFDERGKLRFKIEPRERAPFELASITDYTINTSQESLEVFDFSLGKIVSFDLSGNPFREKRFNYYLREFSRQSNGDYVVYSPDLLNDKTPNTIEPGAFVTDSTGKFKYSFLLTQTSDVYSEPINCLSGFGDSITLVSNYTKDVFLINNDKVIKLFRLKYDDDWEQSLITSHASGSNINITYRKDIADNSGNPVYLNAVSHSQLHLKYMFNDLFAMPVITPIFYKDGRTMIGFLTAGDLKKIDEFVRQRDSLTLKVDKQLTGKLLAIAGKMTENDNPVMITFRLKNEQ